MHKKDMYGAPLHSVHESQKNTKILTTGGAQNVRFIIQTKALKKFENRHSTQEDEKKPWKRSIVYLVVLLYHYQMLLVQVISLMSGSMMGLAGAHVNPIQYLHRCSSGALSPD